MAPHIHLPFDKPGVRMQGGFLMLSLSKHEAKKNLLTLSASKGKN
jgi:hypothetical protein